MPTNPETGKYHMSPALAKGASKAPKKGATDEPAFARTIDGGSHTTLHDHGDGTFHTESHDGEQTEHPHIGHALMHMGAKHAGGKHLHVHHDGASMTSHHVAEDGEVEGPHDHQNLDDLKSSMDQFLNEEGHEDASNSASDNGEEDLSGF